MEAEGARKSNRVCVQHFSSAINKYREELGSQGVTSERFISCLMKAAGKPSTPESPKMRNCSCSCILKFSWLFFLGTLAFALVVAGFSPLSFIFHKWINNKIHHILRPLRIIVATILPYLAMLNLDFLHTDCLIPNPLLFGADGCPCFNIKNPVEATSNYSAIPSYLYSTDNFDINVLRNYTQLSSTFSVDTLINFPKLHNGVKPVICMEVPGINAPLRTSYEFYNRRTIYEAFSNKMAWTFSWLECPEEENNVSLREIIPPLNPHSSASTNSTFSIGTKWGAFANYKDFHPDATIIIVRVLVGHVRFVMEPANEACMEYCSKFKGNPVLQAGDALIFNQKAWDFSATAWSDITFFMLEVLV